MRESELISYNRPEESRENAFFDDYVSNTDKT